MTWFEINEGWIDRVLRVVLGFALLFLVFFGPKTPWGWIGVLPIVTGAVGYCPLYALFRVSTCGSPHRLIRHA